MSVCDLSTERGKVLRPNGAAPLVTTCASAEGRAGSDGEDGEVRAEGSDVVSMSITYLSSWGLG